ncbi:MAG TPA: hypothetical protein VHN77_01950 [Phycisphaerales bacterium]|nr:hypothetical protein [Phycisphaerales bacterium]
MRSFLHQFSRLARSAHALFCIALLACVCSAAPASVLVFEQPPNPAGGHSKSAWYPPDGLDGDEYAWESFVLPADTAITEVRWRGCYTNYLSGAGTSPVFNFTVAIYRSIAVGSQPDLGTGGRLVRYYTGSNAGETAAGIAGGVAMYDYAFTLPSPFQATAGTKYWVQIVAHQGLTPTYYWPPDWSFSHATGGNGSHFRYITGSGQYQSIPGDLAFSLWASSAPAVTIIASVTPVGAGTVSGAGSYPINSTATLTAAPNAGWGFVNWTEGASQVGTNATYTFSATVNRTLIAHFVPAYTITTFSVPMYGGTVTGAGTYNEGSTVTLTAEPNPGFVFTGWSDGSTDVVHTFPATTDLWITALFENDALSETFDFDTGPVHVSLPVNYSMNGLGVNFTGTAGNYSIQPTNSLGFTPAGFGGNCIYPNTVFPADLVADFSQPLTFFSILYTPQELGCDNSATMRVTTYLDGAFVATNTTTVPTPGTWPTGTLAITSAPFNRAVVHYDARPPTCQDWGSIFLADVVTVTRACSPCGSVCDTIDFNNDGLFPDTADIDDFLSVFSGGPCSNDPPAGTGCGDIDFNNDGLFPDTLDIDSLLSVFSGGACL